MAVTTRSGCYPTAKTENQDDEWLNQFMNRPAESDIYKDNYDININGAPV